MELAFAQVIKLISQVIADFADGEISQASLLFQTDITLERYLDKSFYKTASLIAASCRCAAVFSDCSEPGGCSRWGSCVWGVVLQLSGWLLCAAAWALGLAPCNAPVHAHNLRASPCPLQ